MAQVDPSQPNYRPQEWESLAAVWEKVGDVYEGLYSDALKLKYLYKKSGESPDDFAARARASELDNRFRSSINANAGLMSQFHLLPSTPEQIAEHENDIDHRGNSLRIWSIYQDVKFLRDGGVLLGVDISQALSEEEQRQERRPWLVSVNIRDVFAPLVESINGKPTLARVSIRRTSFEPKAESDFDRQKVFTYWVYRLEDGGCTLQKYRQVDDDGGEPQPGEKFPILGANGEPLPMLPFVWYGVTDTLNFSESKPIPPFMALCELNLKHFNKGSELDRAESICNIPTPKRGWPGVIPDDPPPFRLGISNCLEYVVGGEIGFLEPSGGSLQLSHQRQMAREARMEAEDRQFFGAGEQAVTATQAMIETGQAQMTLSTVAERKESAIQELFTIWMLFSDPSFTVGDEVGGIQINEKVLLPPPNPQMVAQYREDVALGLISRQDYQKVMLRLGVYEPEDFEHDNEITAFNGNQPMEL